jgi:hypothetical protein
MEKSVFVLRPIMPKSDMPIRNLRKIRVKGCNSINTILVATNEAPQKVIAARGLRYFKVVSCAAEMRGLCINLSI